MCLLIRLVPLDSQLEIKSMVRSSWRLILLAC